MLRSNRFLGPRFVFRTPARVGGTHSGALCVGSGSGLALWALVAQLLWTFATAVNIRNFQNIAATDLFSLVGFSDD